MHVSIIIFGTWTPVLWTSLRLCEQPKDKILKVTDAIVSVEGEGLRPVT